MKRYSSLGLIVILVFAAALAWSQSASLPKRWYEGEQVISRDVDRVAVWLADKIGSTSFEIQSPADGQTIAYQASTTDWINQGYLLVRATPTAKIYATGTEVLIGAITDQGAFPLQVGGATYLGGNASVTGRLDAGGLLRVEETGVGVGHTNLAGTSGARFHVNGGTVFISSTTGDVGFYLSETTTGAANTFNFFVRNAASDYLAIGNTAQPIAVTLSNAGNVGIATTTPGATLTVEGATIVTGTSSMILGTMIRVEGQVTIANDDSIPIPALLPYAPAGQDGVLELVLSGGAGCGSCYIMATGNDVATITYTPTGTAAGYLAFGGDGSSAGRINVHYNGVNGQYSITNRIGGTAAMYFRYVGRR